MFETQTVKLSLIIPTYNESQNIPILLARLNTSLCDIDKEVIVVDDNSPDKTWEIARSLTTQYPWLRVIRRVHEKGLSSAVLMGFSISEGDVLAVIDADLQHDEKILPQFVQAFLNGADIVIGSRKAQGGHIENWNPMRRLMSWIATQMAKLVLQQPVTDPMSGFFAIRKEIYQTYKDKINPRGFKILLEFLARAKNAHTQEIGYTFQGRIHGESKLSNRVIYDYLHALYTLSVGQYVSLNFLKYVAVGLSGLVVSYLVLLLGLNVFSLSKNVAVNLSIEVSIVTNFVLNNLWTFRENKLSNFFPFLRGMFTFHAICLSGAVINHMIALKAQEYLGHNLYFSNGIGYVIAAFWNYAINVKVTWNKSS